MQPLHVQMFGDFTLAYGDSIIADSQNRTKKVWMLLAYILSKKEQIVSRKELIQLLWGDDATSNNPENALKITFYRVRTLLDQLAPNFGHQLVKWQDNGYTWTREIPTTLDIDQFETLLEQTGNTDDETLEIKMKLISLYKGEFLSNLPEEDWMIPYKTRYHNAFVDVVMETIPLLSARGRHEEAIKIAKRAISMEPYNENLYMLLMQEYAHNGNQEAALAAYDTLSQRLFSDFGRKPGSQIYEEYRMIMLQHTDKTLSMESVLDSLLEKNSSAGALKCDYDYFRTLCFLEARISARTGIDNYIVLLSVTGKGDKLLSKKIIEQAMEQTDDCVRLSLRRGDAYTRGSISQFIILLREANYDNSCMVARRIVNVFNKTHPRSSTQLSYKVDLLTPGTMIQ